MKMKNFMKMVVTCSLCLKCNTFDGINHMCSTFIQFHQDILKGTPYCSMHWCSMECSMVVWNGCDIGKVLHCNS